MLPHLNEPPTCFPPAHCAPAHPWSVAGAGWSTTTNVKTFEIFLLSSLSGGASVCFSCSISLTGLLVPVTAVWWDKLAGGAPLCCNWCWKETLHPCTCIAYSLVWLLLSAALITSFLLHSLSCSTSVSTGRSLIRYMSEITPTTTPAKTLVLCMIKTPIFWPPNQ